MEAGYPALAMRAVRKEFPGVVALDNVDFELRRGEVHVLLGENGAGKSTLMKILSGAYQKDDGEILLDGEQTEIRSPRHAQDLGIAIVYQEFNLVPQLSAAENIFLGREPCLPPGLVDKKRMADDARRLLDELGEAFDPLLPVKSLSVAHQQMVEVAKTLSMNATILIMDEPTSALTENEIENLFVTIRRLQAKGVSVVYISHRLQELFQIGDRVTVLRDGKYVGTYRIDETTPRQLVRLMADRDLTDHFPKRKAPLGDEVLRVESLSTRDKLDDVSFSLRRGEVLGIAGLLGSGRTELARAIFGADAIDAGQVSIRQEPVRISSPTAAIRRGIGFLTEDRKEQGLVLSLSLKHNIGLSNMDSLAPNAVINTRSLNALAQRFVDKLRIKTPSIAQKVVNLSGGNQQKVALAKWLARDVDVLIFDEPTRGIDVGAKVDIYELMNELAANGVGIIMISSELPEILGMSDRILVMSGGRVAREFSSGEATQEEVLGAALGH
jgi:ribose transport system ATP-binding protein